MNIQDGPLKIHFGASDLGLAANMPSGPGVISDEEIRSISTIVPPGISSFMLTSETSAEAIILHHQQTLTNTIQIADELKQGTYQQIKAALPANKLVQVIHVIDEASIDQALQIAESVDALLLDSGNPNLSIKELGGTCRVHNWTLSKKIVERSKVPVFLAGGLKATNIQQAIDQVQPFYLTYVVVLERIKN
jgi:phosphoribosylanthranilate isomerase